MTDVNGKEINVFQEPNDPTFLCIQLEGVMESGWGSEVLLEEEDVDDIIDALQVMKERMWGRDE